MPFARTRTRTAAPRVARARLAYAAGIDLRLREGGRRCARLPLHPGVRAAVRDDLAHVAALLRDPAVAPPAAVLADLDDLLCSAGSPLYGRHPAAARFRAAWLALALEGARRPGAQPTTGTTSSPTRTRPGTTTEP